MKPFTKSFENRIVFTLTCACVLAYCCSPTIGFAQSDSQFGQFNESIDDVIRDSQVVATDFQSDVQDQVGGSLEELREKFSTTMDGFGQPVADEFTSTLKSAGQDIMQHDSVAPWLDRLKASSGRIELPKVLGSLAIVIGGYLGFVWLTRRLTGSTGDSRLPQEVVEVLGQMPFGPKKNLQLVRLGSKLLLLMHSPEGTTPIGEITDPQEVEYLASVCSGRKTGRSPVAIRKAGLNNDAAPNGGGDLKRILKQLERTGTAAAGSVFEA